MIEEEDVIVEKEVVRGAERRVPSILAKYKVSKGESGASG
jgi:hypothetical protein